MVKKVPDWLNSSLWSSSQSSSPPSTAASPFQQPSRPLRHAATIPSEPPPPPVVQDPPLTQIIEDSPIEEHGDVFPSGYDVTRQAQLLAELSKKVVDMSELRSRACQGIPDAAGIRSTVWKLLLGYLPPDRGLWSSELAKKRSQYKQFKDEILMNPSEITRKMYNPTICDTDDADCGRVLLSRSEITHGEHPLSLGKTSVWNQFFQDTEIIDQIDRDVKRTHPDMHFFCGVRYVQGMNELLAPLFYVFKNDPDEENAAFAEADAFFCFVELLSGLRDNFVQQLDNSVVGIRSTITRLSQLLREHDEELWRHLEVTSKVNPQFYAFRWITLLLTQEFNFADSLHIWDTLLSDPDGPQETLLRVCCAMLVLVRKRLLAGDFTSNLKLLQNYPTTNISHLLYVANKFRVQSV
ncbi:TBC1 domain family member 13-like isoform X3 [Vigna umbellata]|uniref:TBC1 domain family member 13-like isoform X3 n=1 Tax=Vigna umbellata TaxID=87088 RepID=UPI001F5ED6F9|nr:TBC1 domain family member 13-like isoform X3 [Vigna umbellata]